MNPDILITLVPGEEYQGNASVCLSVCLSESKTQKTLALINLIFFTKEVLYPWLGPPLRRYRLDMDSRIYERILHRCEI